MTLLDDFKEAEKEYPRQEKEIQRQKEEYDNKFKSVKESFNELKNVLNDNLKMIHTQRKVIECGKKFNILKLRKETIFKEIKEPIVVPFIDMQIRDYILLKDNISCLYCQNECRHSFYYDFGFLMYLKDGKPFFIIKQHWNIKPEKSKTIFHIKDAGIQEYRELDMSISRCLGYNYFYKEDEITSVQLFVKLIRMHKNLTNRYEEI